MAQAAEVLEFPAGGIADFYMEDHEIEALEREEAAQEFGSTGIATFEPIATRMASYGRYGDDTVAHVETGELMYFVLDKHLDLLGALHDKYLFHNLVLIFFDYQSFYAYYKLIQDHVVEM